jgi:hypothetical protein
MLVRLTRAKRLRAGRLLALVYALCILAPTLSFALPGSRALSPCLTDTNHVPGMTHMHANAPTTHLHAGGNVHDHAATHAHGDASHDDAAMASAVADADQSPAKGSHGSGGQCCGLMCLTALPATLEEIVTPSVPMVSRPIAGYLAVADNGPSRHYRPPIA